MGKWALKISFVGTCLALCYFLKCCRLFCMCIDALSLASYTGNFNVLVENFSWSDSFTACITGVSWIVAITDLFDVSILNSASSGCQSVSQNYRIYNTVFTELSILTEKLTFIARQSCALAGLCQLGSLHARQGDRHHSGKWETWRHVTAWEDVRKY